MSFDSVYPRTLVISINAFSRGNSNNGKVLSQLFSYWDKKSVAQFFVMNEMPDSPTCNNYYRITDKEALKAFTKGIKGGGRMIALDKQSPKTNKITRSTINGNPLTRLLRDVVWNSNRWMSQDFWDWISAFSPEVIFVMVGGSSFIPNLAMKVSRKLNIPIVVFNTENYYFKKNNYFPSHRFWFLYNVYHAQFKRSIKKLYAQSKANIFLNNKLKELYHDEFQIQGTVIYQSTGISSNHKNELSKPPKFVYAGNIFPNRDSSLIEVANTLHRINDNYVLDVYGDANNLSVEEKLRNTLGIRYHGRVPYAEIEEVIKESDFLFHVESFEKKNIEDLQTAFSTKIGDSLASGKCFVVYADKTLACTEYLIENNCACVITSPDQLESSLREIIESSEKRDYYIEKALNTARLNHNIETNTERLRKTVLSVVKNEDMSN